ncbi:MAG: rod shape-determining protein MreC [Gammaproteobacteria bacterium]|nr:rod shape-determining protein MreC [Gammaproteobacteria bacterium]
MKSLFLEERAISYKLLGFCLLSSVLMAVDQLSDLLDGPRSGLMVVITPVVVTADLPGRALRGVERVFQTRSDMRGELDEMRAELLLLRAKTGKMAALTAENNRLRDLLGSAAKLQDNVLVAEMVAIDPNPERLEIIIDKGSRDGVFAGQPLLDAEGLMGQVVEVSPFTSRVLLLSDPTHSVPVQVARSNLRLIAQGTGVMRELELMHVQGTADIKVGDLLVSSGLGGRFPVGYPVGLVNSIDHDPGEPFAVVRATSSALLDRSRHVLLVFTEERLTVARGNGGDARGG